MDYNDPVGIDLHIHSTASDGTLTPSEILDMAGHLNLRAIAITDHDTIDGTREALQIGIPSHLEFVTGVEISAAPIPPFDAASSYHILGYFFRIDDHDLNQTLNRLQNARQTRNTEIVRQLNRLGIDISAQDVLRETSDGQAGRPHVARALIRKGIVSTIDQAFDTFLGNGRPAYVDKFRISCPKAIELIVRAGGIPVLAHPGLLKVNGRDRVAAFFSTLKEAGLRGVEVYYPEHSHEQMTLYAEMADACDLLITGGTDFHGEITPGIAMGSGDSTLFIPFSLYEKLAEAAGYYRNLPELEETLGYLFHDRNLLEEAVRHSSFVNEQPQKTLRDNERFEFLGDAVLNLAVGHLLMKHHPDLHEGELTKVRANTVNEHQLASIARSMDLGRHILLGKGEAQTGGHEKNSILADTLEAVIAAVYLDGGYAAAFDMIEAHFSHLLGALPENAIQQDFKSQLQEFVQCLQKPNPQYQVVEESGPDHDKTFVVRLDVCDLATFGQGKSKKAAEQDAARNALERLRSDDHEPA